MCWCNPSIRAIQCGSSNCIPPTSETKEQPVVSHIDQNDIDAMREKVRHALNPNVSYSEGMSMDAIVELVQQTRYDCLIEVNNWLTSHLL